MYTIINSKFIRFDGDKSIHRVEIVADTEADIPEVQGNWSAGSIVFITAAHEIKVLNNKKEWE